MGTESEVVAIFGATGGIGSELARTLVSEGKRVALCSRNETKLKSLSEELQQPFFVCNGCLDLEVKEVFEKIQTHFGRIDGVVNCIGSFFIKPFSLTTPKDWDEILRTHVISSFSISQAALSKMVGQKSGAIVLISSCAAQIGLVHHEVIAAAKGAIEGFVLAAAASYAKKGIRINAVAPGLVDTELSSPITSNELALKGSLAFHPMGRIGKPIDIAEAISWLLSDKSSWMTGQVLSVDGGLAHLKIAH